MDTHVLVLTLVLLVSTLATSSGQGSDVKMADPLEYDSSQTTSSEDDVSSAEADGAEVREALRQDLDSSMSSGRISPFWAQILLAGDADKRYTHSFVGKRGAPPDSDEELAAARDLMTLVQPPGRSVESHDVMRKILERIRPDYGSGSAESDNSLLNNAISGGDYIDSQPEIADDDSNEKRYSHSFVGKRGYSHSFVGKRGYTHSFVGKRPSGYSHSFVGKRGYSHSFVGKRPSGYSHSFVGKRGYSHSFVGKRPSGYSHSFIGKRPSGYSHSFIGKRDSVFEPSGKRDYSHSFVGKRGYSHSFVGKRDGKRGYTHSFVGKRAPGYSHSFVGKRGYTHSFVGKRAPGYSHSFVGKRGYTHSFVGKRGYSHSFVGKREPDTLELFSEALSDTSPNPSDKRGYSHSFVGKRGYTHSFVGKRGYSHNFVGKRGYSHSFVGKRTPGYMHAFVGKRSSGNEDVLAYSPEDQGASENDDGGEEPARSEDLDSSSSGKERAGNPDDKEASFGIDESYLLDGPQDQYIVRKRSLAYISPNLGQGQQQTRNEKEARVKSKAVDQFSSSASDRLPVVTEKSSKAKDASHPHMSPAATT